MKKIAAATIIFFAGLMSAGAQKGRFPEWDDNPVMHTIPAEYAGQPALFLLQDVSMDYRYEGKDIVVYYTLHRIIKVMDERGIESFNKIAIPVYHGTKITSVKARTVLPGGKVKNISEDVMKISRNEQGAPELVFAMEGVEKNAEIELLIKEMRPASYFGSEIFQYPVPVLNARFEMAYPKEMVFGEKGYNGFPDAYDTLLGNRRHIIASISNIPGLEEEKNSYYDRYRMRAEYRINYLTEDNEKTKLFTWDDLAKRLHENFYTTTAAERKAVSKFLTACGVTDNTNEFENVQKIENGIKSHITLYDEIDDDDNENLDSIITKKAATEAGYVKLFATCFTQAGVHHELGVTSDREEHSFDSKFANWGTLAEYLFYFPSLDKFLSPGSVYLRCPVLPANVLGNKGLFCTIPPGGEHINGPLSEVVTTSPLPAKENHNDITAAITFGSAMDVTVNVTYSCTGYAAAALRKVTALREGGKKELVNNVVTFTGKKSNIVSYTISNEGLDKSAANVPVEVTAVVKGDELLEKAGPQYLLKVGDIIGRQTELYQAKERKLPIDIPYPESLNRVITVNIPKGYKIFNPGAVRLHADHKGTDGNIDMSFTSDYKLQGSQLIITISECYTQVHYHASEYESYRSVINSAADFNKVTLLMGK